MSQLMQYMVSLFSSLDDNPSPPMVQIMSIETYGFRDIPSSIVARILILYLDDNSAYVFETMLYRHRCLPSSDELWDLVPLRMTLIAAQIMATQPTRPVPLPANLPNISDDAWSCTSAATS